MRVEAPTFVGGDSWVFYPESEPAVCRYRCDEVGVDRWWQPLDLE